MFGSFLLIFMIAVIQSVRDPGTWNDLCRSKDLSQNNSYQPEVKRTHRASQVIQSYILAIYSFTLLHTCFFVCMVCRVESCWTFDKGQWADDSRNFQWFENSPNRQQSILWRRRSRFRFVRRSDILICYLVLSYLIILVVKGNMVLFECSKIIFWGLLGSRNDWR